MKNLSEMNINTSREQVVNSACSNTGLSKNIVEQIFESQKLYGKTNQEINDYFDKVSSRDSKFLYTSEEFLDSINNVLKDVIITEDNKSELTKKFLDLLLDNSVENNIDTINLIDVVNNVLIAKNPKAKDKLIPILSLDFKDSKLNESFNLQLTSENNENTVMLYEGLKEILNKNNPRWGITYHIQNSYNAIMKYIDDEIEEIQLNSKMYSVTNEYHILILNDMLSGSVSPLYKHVSSVKELVPDLQTLVFDMILLVEKYFQCHDSSLEFVNKQTFNEYNDSGNMLLKSIVSSLQSSKIINDETKKRYLSAIENNGIVGSGEIDYYGKDDVLKQLANSVDSSKVKYNIWNISLKSVVDMLNFIKSSSMEFNLKIRPIMRTYITKSYLLTSSVEKADLLRKKASSY